MSSKSRGTRTMRAAFSVVSSLVLVLALAGGVAAAGGGTISVDHAAAAGGASGQSFTFDYVNDTDVAFAAGSLLSLTIPAGWTAPSTTAGAEGYVTIAGTGMCSPAVTIAGQKITVAQTCGVGDHVIIGYAKVTPPVATGDYAFTTQTTSGGIVTTLASSPTITVDTLAITFIKELCPRYSDVPANSSPDNIDHTGGHWAELNTTYGTGAGGHTVSPTPGPTGDIPAACAAAPGWSFELREGSKGKLIQTVTTAGSGGSSTVYLGVDDIAWGRGGGVWVYEVMSPAAGFGSLRCYRDVLNGDNEDYVGYVPMGINHAYCIAYNVAGPGISLTKRADTGTYTLGQTITYTYTVINTSNVPAGPAFTVADDKIDGGTPFTCDASSALSPNFGSLAAPSAGSSTTCTKQYVVKPEDISAGSITNTAKATYTLDGKSYESNEASVTVNAADLTLAKTADVSAFSKVGDVIAYTYTLTNTGNVTLSGPFTITDSNIATVECASAALSLAAGATTTCTATATATQADLDAGKVTNLATGHGFFGPGDSKTPIDSAQTSHTVNAAKLGIAKKADLPAFSKVNDKITYTYTLTNTGNATLVGPFTVTDSNIATVDCEKAALSLAAGVTTTCTATATVTQSELDAGFITNTATGHGFFVPHASKTPIDSAETSLTVNAIQGPALTISKSLDLASATTYGKVNDKITYKYTLTNSGNVSLTGPFTVSDTKIAGSIPCGSGSLAPLATTACTATYTVTQADINTGSVYNEATGQVTYGGKVVDSNTDHLTVNATQRPALTIAKVLDPTSTTTFSAVGNQITYKYTLTNSGNVTLAGPFTVSDTKIAGSIACGSGDLAPLATTTCTATYTVTQADLDAGKVTNLATGQAYFGTTPIVSGQATVTVKAKAGSQKPAMSLVKTAGQSSFNAVGQSLSYTYTLTNTGNVTLTGPFTVIDTKIGNIPCGTGSLAPGALPITCTATYSVTQTDIELGSVINWATGWATFGSFPVASNLAIVTVDAVQTASISVSKTANPKTYSNVGDQIDYSYVITNTGNVYLFGPVTLSDDKIVAPNSVTCLTNPALLKPGATVSCSAKYTITQTDINAGHVTNTAIGQVRRHLAGNATVTSSAQATVTANKPALTIAKTLDPASATTFSKVNDKITYEYTLTNSGNVTLTGPFTVSDTKIAGLIACGSGNLAPLATTSCTATYTVTQADINTGSVYNQAYATAKFQGTDVQSTTVDLTVNGPEHAPALAIAKTASPKTYSAVGDVITYDITLTNSGNVTLSGPFTVDDPMVTNLDCGTLPASLVPDDEIKCTASYTIKLADLNKGSVTNTATAHATFREAPVDSGTATAIANAVQGPALSIVKTASSTTYAVVGEIVHFAITLTNGGNVTLANPSVSDPTVADLACGEGQGMPTFLVPGQKVNCTASHTITQDDINAGSFSNTATGHAVLGETTVDTDPSTVTLQAVQGPKLDLKKAANQANFLQAGDKIDYTYTLTNSGNVTLTGPFSVTDDKITDPNAVTCPATPTSLAHGETIVCTATYTVTAADVSAGSVVNTASAGARFGDAKVGSDPKIVTVPVAAATPPSATPPAATPTPTPAGTEIVGGATATPARAATPPVTSSNGNSPTNDSLPLMIILIALAFGGLGLLAVQAQRGTIRR